MPKNKGIQSTERQYNAIVGRRLEELRKSSGLTRRELAACAGICDTMLYYYEIGSYRCPPFVLDVFAQVLGVALRELMPKRRLHEEFLKSCAPRVQRRLGLVAERGERKAP